MGRKIVNIDEEKCTGCGLCVNACHEGALELVDGKARLVSESYCDGLGDCLPKCPSGAIAIEEREAEAYDEEAVKKHINKNEQKEAKPLACGCPGTQTRTFSNRKIEASTASINENVQSELRQWPCQLKLVPADAPFFDKASLLIAADCTAYAYAGIHQKFMRNKITLIGCPKLDNIDYSEKLTEILKLHEVKSITILRMEVPCCGGIVNAVKSALSNSGRMIPWSVVTISTEGNIIEE